MFFSVVIASTLASYLLDILWTSNSYLFFYSFLKSSFQFIHKKWPTYTRFIRLLFTAGVGGLFIDDC
jgi:hypothetical protein